MPIEKDITTLRRTRTTRMKGLTAENTAAAATVAAATGARAADTMAADTMAAAETTTEAAAAL